MFDYALLLMIGAIILNLKSDGFIVAGAFLLVSLILGYLLESSASVEGYAIYAFGELLFIHIIHSQIDAKTLVSDMINLSRLSIVVQLLGAVAWIEYYDSTYYLTACEAVFTMQILRLFAYGFATRKAANIWGYPLDYLNTNHCVEKL